MIFYKSSDLHTVLSSIIEARGETWLEVTQRMGRSGRSFRRQVRRPEPTPSADLFFKCLRVLDLELVGCGRVSPFINLLNHARREVGWSYRQLAKKMVPKGCPTTVTRTLEEQNVPRLATLLAIACALDVHPELLPSRSLAR